MRGRAIRVCGGGTTNRAHAATFRVARARICETQRRTRRHSHHHNNDDQERRCRFHHCRNPSNQQPLATATTTKKERKSPDKSDSLHPAAPPSENRLSPQSPPLPAPSSTPLLPEMWVFGYGSLIWKVDFPVEDQIAGYIDGYVRRFWQGSHDHRGTPDRPGRVATLVPIDEWSARFAASDPHPPARVWGVAFKVPDDQAAAVRAHLDHRERNGYDTKSVCVYAPDGSVAVEGALLYIATTSNEAFLGPAPSLDLEASNILHAEGLSGTNRAYLYNLAHALNAMLDKQDPHIDDLTERVRKLEASQCRSVRPSLAS